MNSPLVPALVVFVLFFFLLFFFAIRRPRSCPACGESLSAFQSPFTKTKRQWWEGGYLCQTCGCESDLAGRRVAPGTPPRRTSVVNGVVTVAVAAIPAALLLAFLLCG